MNPSESTRICVCILTFKRPDMLAALFDKLSSLSLPPGSQSFLLIVDNDVAQSGKGTFDENRHKLHAFEGAYYSCEQRQGIATARNHALKRALELDTDLICFIDDDELPDRDWLTNLAACAQTSRADLVGGPVQFMAPRETITAWQRYVFVGCRRLAVRRETAARNSKNRMPTILTNNWCIRSDFLRSCGILFDESFNSSGGEDTDFFYKAIAAGCATHWCARAKVSEIPTLDRLTLRYQFHREMHKSLIHYHQKVLRSGRKPVPVTLLVGAVRITLGVMAISILFWLPWAAVSGVRSIGWGIGRIRALNGNTSAYFVDAR
jgi:GT2 family glycosyltransferase